MLLTSIYLFLVELPVLAGRREAAPAPAPGLPL